jgi:very-short-patch-repair endonuclease
MDPTFTSVARARSLRRSSTDAESLLWRHLRAKRFGVNFRRQRPYGPYILDFYCHDKCLVIEVDGGQHFLPEQQTLDSARTDFLEQQGLTVLRFTNREVFLETEQVLQESWLHLHGPADEKDGTPSPLGRGQGRGPTHDNLASKRATSP